LLGSKECSAATVHRKNLQQAKKRATKKTTSVNHVNSVRAVKVATAKAVAVAVDAAGGKVNVVNVVNVVNEANVAMSAAKTPRAVAHAKSATVAGVQQPTATAHVLPAMMH